MSDPYTRPSRHSAARGSSQQREEPPPGSSQQREEPGERWWEDHRSSSGSPGSRINLPPEEVGLNAEEEQDPYFEAEDHVLWHYGSLKINLKVIILLIKLLLQYLHQTRGSCMKLVSFVQDCLMERNLEHNSSGERSINLRDWGYLLTGQRVILRRQDIRRLEWEKLPWPGHLCYLFTRAWEAGRWKSHHKKMGELNEMRTLWEGARARGSDWMRGQVDTPRLGTSL